MLPEIVHIKLVDAEKFNQAMYDAYRTGSGISPKVAIIKVIRNLTGISLKKAKIYMESVVDEHCTYTFQLDNVDVPLFENSKSVLDELGVGMISNDESIDEDVSPYDVDGTTIEEIAILAIKRKDFDILEDCVMLLKKLVQADDRA